MYFLLSRRFIILNRDGVTLRIRCKLRMCNTKFGTKAQAGLGVVPPEINP